MNKHIYIGKKGEGLFRATLLLLEQPELAILFLAGDGSSEGLQGDQENDLPFPLFLDQNLPDHTDLVIDAENLSFAGSLLLGILGDLFYNKKKSQMLFVTGGDFEVRKKLEQLIKLYSIGEDRFLFWLDEALDRFQVSAELKDRIFVEKTAIGGTPGLSPELNFIRRTLGKGDRIDEKIVRAKNFLERLYREGFFQLEEMSCVLVLSAPLFQLIVFLYLRDVLGQHELYDDNNEAPGKIYRSELEWIVHEIMENSRMHGYDGSDFGIVFVYRRVEKDRLIIIFEDHGGRKPSSHRGAHGAYLGVQNLLLDKFTESAYHNSPPPIKFEKGVEVSSFDQEQRLERARKIIQTLLKEGSPIEEFGPGYRVILNFPLSLDSGPQRGSSSLS